ncbi:hypothetical protein [Vibrio phage vB_VhaS-a]|nr:hypothetical protein [Vibrio phage vB_VhaS-a]
MTVHHHEASDVIGYFMHAKHKEFFEYPSYAICYSRAFDAYGQAIMIDRPTPKRDELIINCAKWLVVAAAQVDRIYKRTRIVRHIKHDLAAPNFKERARIKGIFNSGINSVALASLGELTLMCIKQAKRDGFYDQLVDTLNSELNQ